MNATPETTTVPAWVDVEERLPEFGRRVFVWGNLCVEGRRAPVSYRRYEPGSRRFWYWSSGETRGSSEVFWWYDGPEPEDLMPPPPLVSMPVGPEPDYEEALVRAGLADGDDAR